MVFAEQVSLADKTTFRIGGRARFFCAVGSTADLRAALAFARERALPVFVLGGGSNVLVSDEGVEGLVMQNQIPRIVVARQTGDQVELVCGAGVVWDDLVAFAVDRGWYGLENLSLIPGSVGAAPVQNIGAYGTEVKDTIAWVEAIDRTSGECRTFTNAECQFDYRHSFFKTPDGKPWIITRVAFLLRATRQLNVQYKDLQHAIAQRALRVEELSAADVRRIVIDIRTRKLPDVRQYGTAGSFFKNPVVSREKFTDLLARFPEMPHFPAGEHAVKIPAGWILDKLCGLRGHRQGPVGVYQNQALVLVNFGGAAARDIDRLAAEMIRRAREKTGITLEPEVQFVGGRDGGAWSL